MDSLLQFRVQKDDPGIRNVEFHSLKNYQI